MLSLNGLVGRNVMDLRPRVNLGTELEEDLLMTLWLNQRYKCHPWCLNNTSL